MAKYRHRFIGKLIKAVIDLWLLTQRTIESIVLDVTDDPNDSSRDVSGGAPTGDRYGLPHRIPMTEICVCQETVNENNQLGIDLIRLRENAAAKKRYFQRVGVFRTDGIVDCPRNL